MIVPLFIIIISLAIRLVLSFISYGGGDATNGASFIDLHNSGYDIYSVKSPWPYFPFANSLLLLWGEISNYLNITVNLSYRLTTSFFDSCIAILIYYYFLAKGSSNATKNALIYALNPVTIIIVSTLGFTDSLALLLLIITVISYEFKVIDNRNIITAFFLTASVSIKPIAIIFYPYFIYKSDKKIVFIITSILVGLLLNSYYLIGASVDSIYNVFMLVIGKIVHGHQVGHLGLGAFSGVVSFGWMKIITMLGAVVVFCLYLLKINSHQSGFILWIFIFLLVFRYNFNPQYLAWIVPFAIMRERNILLYLIVSGLSIIVVVFDWYSSTAAFSVLSWFEIDRVNDQSLFAVMYLLLQSPAFIGGVLITSMLFIITKNDYAMLISNIKKMFSLLPYMHLYSFVLLVMISLVLGIIYTISAVSVDDLRVTIYLRVIFLVILPSLLMLYGISINKIYNKRYFIALTLITFLFVCLLSFVLKSEGVEQIYNTSLIYGGLIGGFSLFLIIKNMGLVTDKPNNMVIGESIKAPSYLRLSVLLSGSLVLLLMLLSWPSLYNAVQNKFVYYKDVNNYEEIIIDQPTECCLYGNTFQYSANIDFSRFIRNKDIETVKLEILSDSYYAVSVNSEKFANFFYSPIYFTRHSTKRNGYKHGLEKLDLTSSWDKNNKVNEVSIINNISAPVKPLGIAGRFIILDDTGVTTSIPLSSFVWSITKGSLDDNIYKKTTSDIVTKLVKVDDIDVASYLLDKDYLLRLVDKNIVFISPQYLKRHVKSFFAPVDIFFIIYVILMLLLFQVGRKQVRVKALG